MKHLTPPYPVGYVFYNNAKDKAAQEMGRKGGAARAASMTPERRPEIARKAAATRWGKPVQSK